jgi:hypothetical protein
LPVKKRFLVLDLNGVLVQSVHCPGAPTVAFSKPEMMDYGGLPIYIKSKLVYLRPWLRKFLQFVQSKWWVVIWSSMKLENTNAIVEFLFKGLHPPCLVLGQDSCRVLITPEGKVVKKPNNPVVNQYLKVLKPILWDQRPSMVGVPYDLRPTRENTFMVDDSKAKNVLNPTSNFIVCPTWTVGKVQDRFLLDLVKYLQALWGSGFTVPEFVRNNPIGEAYMEPKEYLYRELYAHAKYNKLI